MSKTLEEQRLLAKLACGILDESVGNEREYRGYKSVFCGKIIKTGFLYHIVKGNQNVSSTLTFLQKYGRLLDDDVKDYSAKFNPERK